MIQPVNIVKLNTKANLKPVQVPHFAGKADLVSIKDSFEKSGKTKNNK